MGAPVRHAVSTLEELLRELDKTARLFAIAVVQKGHDQEAFEDRLEALMGDITTGARSIRKDAYLELAARALIGAWLEALEKKP